LYIIKKRKQSLHFLMLTEKHNISK